MALPNQTPAMLEGMLRFINLASAGLKRAGTEIDGYKQAAAAATALVPDTVKMMVDGGQIDKAAEPIALVKLASHDQTLQVLRRALQKIAEQQVELKDLRQKSAGAIGDSAADPSLPPNGRQKQASAITGQRTGNGDVRPKDTQLFAALGLNPPSNGR